MPNHGNMRMEDTIRATGGVASVSIGNEVITCAPNAPGWALVWAVGLSLTPPSQSG